MLEEVFDKSRRDMEERHKLRELMEKRIKEQLVVLNKSNNTNVGVEVFETEDPHILKTRFIHNDSIIHIDCEVK